MAREEGNVRNQAGPLDPAQVIIHTKTATVPLTGIAQAAPGRRNPADFAIQASGTTCGKSPYANAGCQCKVHGFSTVTHA